VRASISRWSATISKVADANSRERCAHNGQPKSLTAFKDSAFNGGSGVQANFQSSGEQVRTNGETLPRDELCSITAPLRNPSEQAIENGVLAIAFH